MNKKNNKGFSLVELIVVIAVMAVLVVVLAPAYLRYVDKSRAQKDASAVGEVVNAINLAVSEETVASEIATSKGATVIVGDDANITVTGSETLEDELQATIGKIDFASNGLNGKTVKISVSEDSMTVKVTEPTGISTLQKLY